MKQIREFSPSDKGGDEGKESKNKIIIGKVQDLIIKNRTEDAIILAKKEDIKTLDENFVKNLLANEEVGFVSKVKLSKVFGFEIPDDVLQKAYENLLRT